MLRISIPSAMLSEILFKLGNFSRISENCTCLMQCSIVRRCKKIVTLAKQKGSLQNVHAEKNCMP